MLDKRDTTHLTKYFSCSCENYEGASSSTYQSTSKASRNPEISKTSRNYNEEEIKSQSNNEASRMHPAHEEYNGKKFH